MNKRTLLALGVLLPCSISLASEKPFTAVARRNFVPNPTTGVLMYTSTKVLIRQPDAKEFDFAGMYWVNLGLLKDENMNLSQYGEVLENVAGDFAVIRTDSMRAYDLAQYLHSRGLPCGTLIRMFGDTVQPKAFGGKAASPIKSSTTKLVSIEQAIAGVDQNNIRATIEGLSNIYTRYHESETGKEVAAGLAKQYQQIAGSRSDVQISTFSHGDETPQNSLVVRIVGQTKPEEVVILGSHIDSINYNNGAAPGADDNASGTATNMEVFRAIMAQGLTFDRTIEIHGYAAEEAGLVGSQDIARKYKQDGRNVITMLQIDMNLYKASSKDQIFFINNYTNDAFNNDLGKLVDQYVTVTWSKASLFGGSSDHESWDRQGFVTAFPFENPRSYNNNIHSSRDTIANSGAFSQAAAFAKMGVAYLGHYAGVKQ